MTHPGETFYPQGVRWDDTITRGTLPDLLSTAASEFAARPAIEFRDRPISYAELEAMAEVAASAFLRAGYGKNAAVALFLGNSPDHPVNFFGALKAGARVVHLSALDGEIALSHKLTDSGARILVTSNLATLLPMALKFLEKGLLDRLIVCEDDDWGAVGNPHTPIPVHPAIVTYKAFVQGATAPAQWPQIAADDVALLQYTGGTTGFPKGAMLSHGNLTSAVSIYDVWGRPARAQRDAIDRVICVLPLFHIFALTVVLLSSIRRGHLISLHQRLDLLARYRPPFGGTGQAGLDRADAAGHRTGRRVAGRSRKAHAHRRGRRNPHQGAERHQGLLEPAEGNRRSLCRRPFPDRRHRLHGR
jgi:long-chain acyl-CoA synthetase